MRQLRERVDFCYVGTPQDSSTDSTVLFWHGTRYQIGFFQVKSSGTKSEASHLCWDSSGGRWEALKLCCMSSGTKSNVSSCGAKVAVPDALKACCKSSGTKLDFLQLWC